MKKKILLIGWDAADWGVITPLVATGKMPHFKKLMNEGSYGKLRTLDPAFSPMLWTSIATGKTADKHGVYGFIEPNPNDESKVQPISGTTRKCHAIWNILNREGYKSNVVGWWPSHPAEPINGVMVSNFFHSQHRTQSTESINSGMIHPGDKYSELINYRVTPDKLGAGDVLRFAPNLRGIDQNTKAEESKRIEALLKITSEAETVFRTGRHLIKNTEWDFTAIYLDAIDHYSHMFMKCHPPKRPTIPEDMFHYYHTVIDQAYIYHDMMLGELLHSVDENTYVILLSDHGFHPNHLRPISLPKFAAAPALEHNPYGVIVITGPDIKADHEISGANLLDITPTLLNLIGLPIGRDMDGKPLMEIMKKPNELRYIDSWEEESGNFGRLPEDYSPPDIDSTQVLQQLQALGYIDGEETSENGLNKAVTDGKYNLSRVYLSKGQKHKSLEILLELFEDDKKDVRFGIDLVTQLIEDNNIELAHEVFDEIELDSTDTVSGIYLEILKVRLVMASRNNKQAEKEALELQNKYGVNTAISSLLGAIYKRAKEFRKAHSVYSILLKNNPDNWAGLYNLGICQLRLEDYNEALDSLLEASRRKPEHYETHYHIGQTLEKLKSPEQAAVAYENCIRLNDGVIVARNRLIDLYEKTLNKPEKAKPHRKYIDSIRKEEIIIVSGMPRSGTSMMMQVLNAGGIPVLTDDIREADDNNEKGYFEYEPVKSIHLRNKWLSKATNKAIKVVAPLLQHLRPEYTYKVIFMLRDTQDILISQEKMKQKLTGTESPITLNLSDNAKLNRSLKNTRHWLSNQVHMHTLYVSYENILKDPKQELEKIAKFLGEDDLNMNDMLSQIDPDLHHIKKLKD